MRPSWQIDLKWAAGLLACVAVVASGVLFSLTYITARDTAEPLATALITAGITDRVTDEEYADVQSEARAHPDAPIALAPVAITVAGSEIAGLEKDDAARLIAGKLATVLYEKGSGEAEALIVEPPAGADKKALSLGPAEALSSEKNSMFQMYFVIAGVVSVVLLLVVAGMSRGAGRLGAPAVVVMLSAVPLAALWALAAQGIGDGDGSDNPAIIAAREAARSASGDLRAMFVIVALAAFATAVLALLGGLVYGLIARIRRPRRVATPAPAAGFAGKPQSLVESEHAS
jgi:hypothetical protein